MRLLNSIPPASEEPFDATAFVRRARRLRAAFPGNSIRLHQALRQTPPVRPAAVQSPGELFADAVAAAMEGGLLRYSARAELLRRSAELGIDGFEANLIIAAVQHRLTESRRPGAHARPRHLGSIPGRNMLIIAAVQLAIIGLAWWLYSL